MRRTLPRRQAALRKVALAAATCIASGAAPAIEIDVGNPDVTLRWDNTVKYTAARRMKDADPILLANPNQDDGDRNFDKGLISNRFDLLSEMDIVYAKRHGLRISAAAWNDSVYNRDNSNPGFAGGAFPNHTSTAFNRFTDETRSVHGRNAELLDAFVFTGFQLGDTKLNLRAGQHSVLWGESLFFGANAIAGGMAPVDVVKLLSVPGTQFKEAIRPVPQVSAQWQLNPRLSLGGFYQFRWEPSRLPAAGSYFSTVDSLQDGAESLLLGPAGSAPRRADLEPKDRGQGGLQLRFQGEETDYGLYLIRFHAKTPQVVTNITSIATPGGPVFLPQSYQLAYHQGTTAFGASASRTFGALNLAIEASIRRDQPLASTHASDLGPAFGGPITTNVDGNPAYALGKTAHVNISGIWTVPSTPLFREASLVFEVMWNRALSIDKNPGAIDTNATRDASALRFVFEPTYRQVTSGLDLGVPIGVGYSPKGSRSRAIGLGFPPENGGDVTIGLNATYLQQWFASLAYTHFFGTAKTTLDATNNFSFGQDLKDRDFLAFSLRRTF